MKTYLRFFIFVLLGLSFTACDGKDPEEDPAQEKQLLLQKRIDAVIPADAMKAIKAMGMPIYEGIDPPDIEGKYLSDALEQQKTNLEDDDPPGTKWEDQLFSVLSQDNENFTATLKHEAGSMSGTYPMIISGSGNRFTLYGVMNLPLDDGETLKMGIVYSGKLEDGGIADLYFALVSVEQSVAGLGWVIKEADGMAKRSHGSMPEEPADSKIIGSAGGKITLKEFEVTIPENAFTTDTKLEISVSPQNGNFEADVASETYTLKGVPLTFDKPLKIAIKPAQDDETIMMAMGYERWAPSAGQTVFGYSFVETEKKDETYEFELPVLEDKTGTEDQKGEFSFVLVKDWVVATGGSTKSATGERFKIYCNRKYKFEIAEQIIDLEIFLENAYDKLQQLGFSYEKRTKWPVEVTLKKMEADGYFSASMWGNNYGTMEISLSVMKEPNVLKATAGHEFFHLVQSLYDFRAPYSKAAFAGPYYWLEEASSTWFEAIALDDPSYHPLTQKNNCSAPFYGFEPPVREKEADYGYGMAAFLKYLTMKYGNSIVLDIWNRLRYGASTALEAVKQALGSEGTSLNELYYDFILQYAGQKIYPLDYIDMTSSGTIDPDKWKKRAEEWKDFGINNSDTVKNFSFSVPPLSCHLFLMRRTGNYTAVFENYALKIGKKENSALKRFDWIYSCVNEAHSVLPEDGEHEMLKIRKHLAVPAGYYVVLYINDGSTEKSDRVTFKMVPTITFTTEKSTGSNIRLAVRGTNAWIDLNDNSKKDSGEEVLGSSQATYRLGAKEISVCGGNMEHFSCNGQKINKLDVDDIKTLKILDCSDNSLSLLHLPASDALEELNCANNKLSEELNLSKKSNLTKVDCSGNKFTSLDVNGDTRLRELNCSGNPITSIDITNCPELRKLECQKNQLPADEIKKIIAALPARTKTDRGTADFTDNAVLPTPEDIAVGEAKNWTILPSENEIYYLLGYLMFLSPDDNMENNASITFYGSREGANGKRDKKENFIPLVRDKAVKTKYAGQGGYTFEYSMTIPGWGTNVANITRETKLELTLDKENPTKIAYFSARTTQKTVSITFPNEPEHNYAVSAVFKDVPLSLFDIIPRSVEPWMSSCEFTYASGPVDMTPYFVSGTVESTGKDPENLSPKKFQWSIFYATEK